MAFLEQGFKTYTLGGTAQFCVRNANSTKRESESRLGVPMTPVLVVLILLACACIALGLREVMHFHRWLRHIRRAEAEYVARNHRRPLVRA
jgi:hypothetical protein